MTSYKRPKYEMIKTHTARRSFCTNAYLSRDGYFRHNGLVWTLRQKPTF